ncbi:Response regulator receiver domain-containing protein [Marinobacter daqiaonensis]|uniref:Response regulator receiver domain-containing protein n=1 Tax=Marinobacter daqiaonensis TaxID=650891 RepID=A0A1I6JPR3_9GAMM|nr:HDOD domain-containing protein [Marinobacter daqiaonensis]SFR80947.1 Response regulator receiver domain-containing protein [Marinobacter daqiaonensis]
MEVLILDADVPISELMETLVSGLFSRPRIHSYRSVADARASLDGIRPDLVITEWDLPDGQGLDLVRAVRRLDRDVPVLMLSHRADRDRVVMAAKYRIQGFVPKPFSANAMQQRLQALLPQHRAAGPEQSFEAMLRKASETQVYLPMEMDPASVMALIEQADFLSAADLFREWRNEAALTARLLDVANSSAFRRSGEPCGSLQEAVRLLGVRMSLNHALALSLDITHRLSDPYLRKLSEEHTGKCYELAELAASMAAKTGVEPVPCYTAGLLHRIGELAVISTAQQFIAANGALENDDVDLALHQWSGPLGNVLKVAWRLPLPLRNLIGAAYLLPRGSSERDRVLMRTAWLLCNNLETGEECSRLLARLGLDAAGARA